MIDWRIVLGALGAGLALALWLESRYRSRQSHTGAAHRLQGTAVLTIVIAAALFVFAYLNPLWQQAAPPKLLAQTAILPISQSTALPPPSMFVMATPMPQTVSTSTPPRDTLTESAYLHIPALGVAQPVIDLPLENGRWDVSSLGEKVGRLGSTGVFPGDTLAPVLAGHMTFPTAATLETGAFANLQYATYGTELIYELNGEKTAYTVTEISRVAPEEVERLYLEDGDSILLVTCTDWDGNGRIYANRLLVRAVRKH